MCRSQGAYDTYTQGMNPLIVMSTRDDTLQVRVYVDEILIHRLADASQMSAQMFIRGTDTHVPLTFARIQPYRVAEDRALRSAAGTRRPARTAGHLPLRRMPKNLNLYPGELVDVYVGAK